MLYRLTPTLIDHGKVFIAESPLYEITWRKRRQEKTYFAYDEQEKSRLMLELGADSCTLQRSKGLGENQPEMMWETTMNPETRRLIQIQCDEPEETLDVFDLLLGDNLAGRKAHIEQNGHLYLDQIDVG